MKPKILIRTDGSPQIGLGHLIRCNALAHMLKDDFKITFFCREIPDAIVVELNRGGLDCCKIENEDEFFGQLISNSIVVLDGYHFDSDYQKKVKISGAKLVCIDDLYNKEFVADLIINHAPGITPQDYEAQPYTQFAIGLEYALLRPSFLEQAKKERKVEKNEIVLVCFGGSDLKNLTYITLKVVLEYSQFKKIIVVTGSAYQDLESLCSLCLSDKRIVHHHAINEYQMLLLLLEAELAIVPASGILLEAIALKCNVISGIYMDNQKFVYTNYNQANCFIDAFDFSGPSLKTAIEQSFIVKVKGQKIIDGNSNKRLLKLFLQLELKDQLRLRKANDSDLQITYSWATDKAIRAFSFQQHEITIEEHTNWFQRKIKNCKCIYLIAEMENQLIGSIRFDINQNEALISYLVSSKFHGQGLGQVLLTKGIEYLVNNKITATTKTIVGFVIPANIPSVKAFERLGFKKFKENTNLKFEMKLL